MTKDGSLLGGGKNTAYKSAAFEHKHGDHHHEVPLLLRRRNKRRRVGNLKPMKFVSLHHHSTFSYLDGFQLPEAHVRRATELNMSALAMTEHGNTFSHVKHEVACEDTGVKPIFGCELYTGLVGVNATQRKYHLTVIAENEVGYRNLLKLVSLAYEQGFYYEATVSWEWLKKYKEGLFILSGCQGSLLFCSFVGGKLVPTEKASYKLGKSVMRRFRDEFGDHYFAEVQAFPELPLTCQANPMIAQAADELGVSVVATMDCHYTEVEEAEIQKILHNIRPGNKKSLEDQAREWGYNVPLCPPPNDLALLRRLEQTGLTPKQAINAVLSTMDIAESCNVVLPKLPMVRYPLPAGYSDPVKLWRDWLTEGWKFRGCHKLPASERARYKAQLAKECAIIEEKDFCDYHLIVADAIRWAKDNGVAVGPARGSAAASLACWLLRITEVNPMPYPSMVFERYIDLNRKDLPDIDMDFDSDTRYRVREYMVSKYGSESVSNVGTFSTFKAKMALDDVARVHRIPSFDVSTIKDLLVERSSGDLRSSATIEDTIMQFDAARDAALLHPEIMKACDLEGNVKGFGVHAAGLIISNGPITDVTSVVTRTVKNRELKVVGLDKYDAERQGLLKLDFLGLNTMAMINEALKQIGMPLQELYDLPLDDPKAIKIFQDNDVVGVFQFEGRAMRSVNGALRADNFKEICDVNALSRPGALHNGSANEYIDIKRGVKRPNKLHPAFDRITASTNYQIVYQEQILRIVREIGDFSWTASAEIRKIISKKVGEQEFNRRWEGFRDGGLKLHEREPDMPPMIEEQLKAIWGMCITAGSYAFCLTGDAVVRTGAGNQYAKGSYTLAELWSASGSKTSLGQKLRDPKRGVKLQQYDADGRVRPAKLLTVERSAFKQPVYEVKLSDGSSFKGSFVHRVLTDQGYVELGDLKLGAQVVCCDLTKTYKQPKGDNKLHRIPKVVQDAVLDRAKGVCEHCGGKRNMEFAHILPFDAFNGVYERYHAPSNILYLCNSCHKRFDYAKGDRRKRDMVGRATHLASVVSVIAEPHAQYVYMLEMVDDNRNYVANGVVHHNNYAHSHAYSLLGYWTAWLKAHHPAAFYAAALDKMGGSTGTGAKIPKEEQLIRDAIRHGILILPPDPAKSAMTWRALDDRRLLAGFQQVEGIAEKTAINIMSYRDEHGLDTWQDLIQIKGIGQKTVDKVTEFVSKRDPFGVLRLEESIAETTSALEALGLPKPTHTAAEVPYERGKDTQVVWLGIIVHRNLRDIFETNRARTGVELDPSEVKNPELNEFLLAEGYDGDEIVNIRYNRFVYPRFRKAIWGLKVGVDMVLIRGVKPGWRTAREIYVREMWVIENE